MFESALIRRHAEGERLVDAGTVAETLLFYEHAHIVCDRGLLSDFLRVIGPTNLFRLLSTRRISITYLRDNLTVITNTQPNGIQFHNYTAFQIGSKDKKKRIPGRSEEIDELVERSLGKSRESKKIAKTLMDYLVFRSLGTSTDLPQGLPGIAREDLHDRMFLKNAIRHTILTLIPNVQLPADLSFDPVFADDGSFLVGTNLDFAKLNQEYHKIFPPEHSTLTPAHLLSFLLNARTDAYLAADYMSEIVTTEVVSGIINLKLRELLSRRQRSLSQIEMFQEHHLEDARSVREAINSGERSFEEFLDLLDRADRFKEWLKGRNPDADLIREYYKAATSETWVDRLPTKSFRFVLATLGGLGADMLFPTGGIGTAIGVGIGASDSLLLDRILKGWRPNHFIEGELKTFTAGG